MKSDDLDINYIIFTAKSTNVFLLLFFGKRRL